MLRPLFAGASLALAAAPLSAATYFAHPAIPTSERFITRDIVWNCGPAACQAATEESRPVVLCQSLAKRAGRIESFVVNGRALADGDLARCNAFAKQSPASAVAAQ